AARRPPPRTRAAVTAPTATAASGTGRRRTARTVQVSAADGRSWVAAKDHNGRLLFDGLLKQGATKTFQDSEKINLVLGDAGAIDLYVNGKKIEDDWQPGAVERLTYTKGDPQAG
ncbi:DUF4115 domain-containing protein, partial [Streptomyces nigra]